jgi:hypothetical protein
MFIEMEIPISRDKSVENPSPPPSPGYLTQPVAPPSDSDSDHDSPIESLEEKPKKRVVKKKTKSKKAKATKKKLPVVEEEDEVHRE